MLWLGIAWICIILHCTHCMVLHSLANHLIVFKVIALYLKLLHGIAIYRTRSLGALRAPTSSWGPFGPLDFVLRALRALRPCDPRSFSQEGRHEGELPKNTGLLSLPSHDDYHECWVNKYRSFVDPAFVIIIMGREREQNRIFCDGEDRGGGQRNRAF